MRILICGGRDFQDKKMMSDVVAKLPLDAVGTRAHTGRIDAAAHDFALASFEAREVAKEAGLEIDWARLKLSEK
jgi:hypothetical protein